MQDEKKRMAVARWLLAGVIMIIVQTMLGGITRLTGSGLSITKWDPLFGIIPPLNHAQWEKAFAGYKTIGQFKYLNSDFSLGDFKALFFWEWLHRFWARLLGLVFIVGFIFFLLAGYFDRRMVKPFLVLFLLGAMQGLIGWIMVATGLNDSHLSVDHVALALHFVSAMILACYTLWFALKLLIREPRGKSPPKNILHAYTVFVLAILFIQLTYGAFMAGLKAGPAAPTWPTINGMIIPTPFAARNIVNDKIIVQFIHRTIAYILVLLIVIWFVMAKKRTGSNSGDLLQKTRMWPLLLVAMQVLLGIFTVLSASSIVPRHFGRFEYLAEAHQLTAMFLLMSLVVNLYVVGNVSVRVSPLGTTRNVD